MEKEVHELMPEIVEDLCHLYQEQERTRALSLDISDLMLSSCNQSPREWVSAGDTSFDANFNAATKVYR